MRAPFVSVAFANQANVRILLRGKEKLRAAPATSNTAGPSRPFQSRSRDRGVSAIDREKQTSPSSPPGPGERPALTRRASFGVALYCLFAPQGQSQVSPEQRPGNTSTTRAPALKGRNRIRFFTGNHGIARAENCAALSGLEVPWNPCSQGDALGWHVAAPSGRNQATRNIKTRQRGAVRTNPKRRRGVVLFILHRSPVQVCAVHLCTHA